MAATNPIKLSIDRQNCVLTTFNGATASLRNLFQSNTQDFEITFVDPPIVATGNYSVANMTGYSMRVSVGATPAGTTGGTPLAIQTSWTYDSVNNKFTGSLALTTTDIDNFLGTSASKQAYFEVNVTLAGLRQTNLQVTFNLCAVVDEGTSTTPIPAASYLTSDETRSQYVPRYMENGGTITIPSPNGVYALLVGCNNDGSARMDIITL